VLEHVTGQANNEPAAVIKTDIMQQPPVTISYSQNKTRIKQNSSGIIHQQEGDIKKD
jgi:hypothetical protein